MLKNMVVSLAQKLFLGKLRSWLEDESNPLSSLYTKTKGWKTATGAVFGLVSFMAWLLGYDPTILASVSASLVGLGLLDKGVGMECPPWVKQLVLYRVLANFSFEIGAVVAWAGSELAKTCLAFEACYWSSSSGTCLVSCGVASWVFFLSAGVFVWLGLFDSALLAKPLTPAKKKK